MKGLSMLHPPGAARSPREFPDVTLTVDELLG
jgi:hypothetical protein